MSHYEERMEQDLERLRGRVTTLADSVQKALKSALHALLTGDDELAYDTVLGDLPINRLVREIDRISHGFIALHLPTAGHLRRISSTLRVNIELERVGDYAANVCRHAVQLSAPPGGSLAREIGVMGEEASSVLRQATQAFHDRNADAAKATMPAADRVANSFGTAFEDLVALEPDRNLRDLFGIFAVLNNLERVAEQAKNVCEEAVFAATGETKAAKRYRILFLDEDDSCLGLLAQAIAAKRHPESGHYRSAGRTAAGSIHADLTPFLESHGLELPKPRPEAMDLTPTELDDLHLLVVLQGSIREYLDRVPFNTSVLHWNLGDAPQGLDGEKTRARFEELYRDLAENVRALMETLRGSDAA